MLNQTQPGVTQMIEKASGIADAGHRVNRAAPETGQGRSDTRINQIDRRIAAQTHQIFPAPGSAVADDEIHLTQAGRRLAQRASRETSAVAKSAQSIDHGNFNIALQAVMLQTVVADDHVAIIAGEQRLGRRDPIRPDHDGTTAALRQQHRLIADFAGIAVGGDMARPFAGITAIAPADHTGFVAGLAQQFHQPGGQRSLAGAADADIADDDDGRSDAMAFEKTDAVQLPAQAHDQAEQQAQRPKQHRDQVEGIAVAIQPGHGPDSGAGGALSVAMVSCCKPNWPATSSTVTTA